MKRGHNTQFTLDILFYSGSWFFVYLKDFSCYQKYIYFKQLHYGDSSKHPIFERETHTAVFAFYWSSNNFRGCCFWSQYDNQIANLYNASFAPNDFEIICSRPSDRIGLRLLEAMGAAPIFCSKNPPYGRKQIIWCEQAIRCTHPTLVMAPNMTPLTNQNTVYVSC